MPGKALALAQQAVKGCEGPGVQQSWLGLSRQLFACSLCIQHASRSLQYPLSCSQNVGLKNSDEKHRHSSVS